MEEALDVLAGRWKRDFTREFATAYSYFPQLDIDAEQVEDCLFKIHRYFLIRESSVLNTMLTITSGQEPAEGGSEDNPIRMHGDLCVDWERLLAVMYPA